jgi:hypothetical protein
MTWFQMAQVYVYLCRIVTHIFQYYLVEEIGLLYFYLSVTQQFLLPQCCTFDDMELWFTIFPKSVSPLVLYIRMSLFDMPVSLIVIVLVQSSIVELCALFSDKLCSKYAINSVSWWWILLGEMCCTHRNWFTFMNFFVLSSFQCHCHGILAFLQYSTWLTDCLTGWLTDRLTGWLTDWPTDWPTDSCTICFILPSYKCCFLTKNEVLYSHRNCWPGKCNYLVCSIYGRSWLQLVCVLQFTNLSKYSVLTVMIV